MRMANRSTSSPPDPRGIVGNSYLSSHGREATRVRYDDAEDGILDSLAMLRIEDIVECSTEHREREKRIGELTAKQVALDHRRQQLIAAAADPEEDLASNQEARKAVVSSLALVEEELRRLKLESMTGRSEHLSETQTLAKLYRAAQGEEKAKLGNRIKAALPSIVKLITIETTRVSPRKQSVLIAIQLRGGATHAFRLLPGEHKPLHIGNPGS